MDRAAAAYAALAWSVVFLVPHVYWAMGGTAGLEGNAVEGALALINALAIVLSLVAGAIALALAGLSRTWLPRRLVLLGAWAVCLLLVLRGGGGIVGTLVVALEDVDDVPTLVLVFEPLFLVGGLLFGLAARNYAATTRPTPP